MTTMIAELYEALVDAGASEGKAKEAAQVLSTENLATKSDITELDAKLSGQTAELDQRLSGQIAKLDTKLSELDQRLSPKIVKLDRDMAVMKWMLGTTMTGVAFILAAVVSMVIKIFFLA